MRRHYRNHISPARSQGMSTHTTPSSAADHFKMDPNEVPALVHATAPHLLGPSHAHHNVYGSPSVHGPRHILVSTPEGQNSVDHGSSTSSSSGEMYHDNHYLYQRDLERKHERNRKKHVSPERLDPYYRDVNVIQHHRHQRVCGQAMDLDHMGSKYAPMPSPPTSQSSLSDADDGGLHMDIERDKPLQPRSRHPPLTFLPSESSRPSSDCLHSQHQQPVVPSSMHCEDELENDQMYSQRKPPSHLSHERSDYSPSNSSLALSRTSSPEEQGRHLSESSTSSRPKYNPSKPYLESLKDSRVSTTLRPAFK